MRPAPDVAIRVASTDNDFEAWFCLYDAVAAERKWIGGEAPSDRAERLARFRAILEDENAVMFLVEADSQLVGTLNVEVRNGIAGLGMFVDRAWRGLGVGSALMEACIAWVREHQAHKVVLEVWPHNTAARGLYRKYGLEEEGFFKRHYRRRNGELWDTISMGLVLDHNSPSSPYGAG